MEFDIKIDQYVHRFYGYCYRCQITGPNGFWIRSYARNTWDAYCSGVCNLVQYTANMGWDDFTKGMI